MVHIIDENFNLHARQIPDQTPGMKIVQWPGLTLVDSGLSCDTFNILHLTDEKKVNPGTLKNAIHYYQDRQLDYCIWVNRENLSQTIAKALQGYGISRQNEEVGMVLELDNYQLRKKSNYRHIRLADQSALISDYAQVLAHNWEPPDQSVLRFYEQTASAYLDSSKEIQLLVYYHEGLPVSSLELFPTDPSTIGIYGFATLKAYRGMGIGSSLFTFALNYAKTAGYRQVILQASDDGLGIYKKYGFKAVTQYYEYA